MIVIWLLALTVIFGFCEGVAGVGVVSPEGAAISLLPVILCFLMGTTELVRILTSCVSLIN